MRLWGCRRSFRNRLHVGFVFGWAVFFSILLRLFLLVEQLDRYEEQVHYMAAARSAKDNNNARNNNDGNSALFPNPKSSSRNHKYHHDGSRIKATEDNAVVVIPSPESISVNRTAALILNNRKEAHARPLWDNSTSNNDRDVTKQQSIEGRMKKPGVKNFTERVANRVSSVDYFACCGAGHRLSKLVDAKYLATKLKFGLRVFWGFCDKQEMYSYLFGPSQPLKELEEQVGFTDKDWHPKIHTNLKVSNDVPGFNKIKRQGLKHLPCPCPKDRFDVDIKFYTSLRNRFRSKEIVDGFMREYFTNKTVIGIHIRTGNGELGDFQKKNRAISSTESWTSSMANRLVKLSKSFNNRPILFVATDTSDMIGILRKLLQDHNIDVVDYSQQNRPKRGQGVFMGQSIAQPLSHIYDKCLQQWESVFIDMMILSHADVVIAARPSSFTQSLPMTMVLSTNYDDRKVKKPYCEVNPTATAMECYTDLMDWCCRGNTSFSLNGIQQYEYRRMPDMEYFEAKSMLKDVTERPPDFLECIPTPTRQRVPCLPYKMPDKQKIEKYLK